MSNSLKDQQYGQFLLKEAQTNVMLRAQLDDLLRVAGIPGGVTGITASTANILGRVAAQFGPGLMSLTGGGSSPLGYAAASHSTVQNIARMGGITYGTASGFQHAYGVGGVAMATASQMSRSLFSGGTAAVKASYAGMSSESVADMASTYMLQNRGAVGITVQDQARNAAGMRRQLDEQYRRGSVMRGTEQAKEMERQISGRERLDLYALKQMSVDDIKKLVGEGSNVDWKRLAKGSDRDYKRAYAAIRAKADTKDIDLFNSLSLDKKEKAATHFRISGGVSSDGKGLNYTMGELDAVVEAAYGRGTQTTVNDGDLKKTKQFIERSARTIKDLGNILGTDSFKEINAAMKSLHVGSLATEKGMAEARKHLAETKAIAVRTGRSASDVMSEQADIAGMLGRSASPELIRSIQFNSAVYSEQDQRYGPGLFTAEQRTQQMIQSRVNAQNNYSGLTKLGYVSSNMVLSDAQRAKVEKLKSAITSASSAEEAAAASAEAEAWISSNIGVDFTQEMLEKANSTMSVEDNANLSKLHLQGNLTTALESLSGKELYADYLGSEENRASVSNAMMLAYKMLGSNTEKGNAMLREIAGGASREDIIKKYGSERYGDIYDAVMQTGNATAFANIYHGETARAENATALTALDALEGSDVSLQKKAARAASLKEDADAALGLANGIRRSREDSLQAFSAGLFGEQAVDSTTVLQGMVASAGRRSLGELFDASEQYNITDQYTKDALFHVTGDNSKLDVDYFKATYKEELAAAYKTIDKKGKSPREIKAEKDRLMVDLMREKGYSGIRSKLESGIDEISLTTDAQGNRKFKTEGLTAKQMASLRKIAGWQYGISGSDEEILKAMSEVDANEYITKAHSVGKGVTLSEDGSKLTVASKEATDAMRIISQSKIDERLKGVSEETRKNLTVDAEGNITSYKGKDGEFINVTTGTNEFTTQDGTKFKWDADKNTYRQQTAAEKQKEKEDQETKAIQDATHEFDSYLTAAYKDGSAIDGATDQHRRSMFASAMLSAKQYGEQLREVFGEFSEGGKLKVIIEESRANSTIAPSATGMA